MCLGSWWPVAHGLKVTSALVVKDGSGHSFLRCPHTAGGEGAGATPTPTPTPTHGTVGGGDREQGRMLTSCRQVSPGQGGPPGQGELMSWRPRAPRPAHLPPGTAVPAGGGGRSFPPWGADVCHVTPGAAWLHAWFQVWEEPGGGSLTRSRPHAWSPEVSSLPSSPPGCLAPSHSSHESRSPGQRGTTIQQ